jgi:membrane protease YdiL (CAAX protease family)
MGLISPPEPEFTPSIAISAWAFVFVVGAIGSMVIVGAAGYGKLDADRWPLWLIATTFIPLWAAVLVALVAVSRRYGSGRFRRDYGIQLWPVDVPVGLLVGVVTQLVFVRLLYRALSVVIDTSSLEKPARQLTDKASGWGIVLLVVVVAIGAPVVEEMFYRGLVLRSFQARINDVIALILSAFLFAAAHFELLQLPGLFLFGLVAGFLAKRARRLGPAIFAHIGFNAATIVDLIIQRR